MCFTCCPVLANYNPDRFDPVALRIFVQKSKPVITLYALDTYKQETSPNLKDKLPVSKFKIKLSWDEFMSKINEWNSLLQMAGMIYRIF